MPRQLLRDVRTRLAPDGTVELVAIAADWTEWTVRLEGTTLSDAAQMDLGMGLATLMAAARDRDFPDAVPQVVDPLTHRYCADT